jgi:putative autotransporter adhesin-like protein
MKKLIFWALIIAVTTTSCGLFGKRVTGSGNIKTETRSAGQFNAVDVSGAIDVYVKTDSVSSIRVEADDNLLEFVETHNDGGTLHIHERNGFNLRSRKDIKVYVSGPEFRHFEASGACEIISENKITSPSTIDIDVSGASGINLELNAPAVKADLSGACNVTLKGETKNLDLNGSGASKFYCFDLLAEDVDVEISGAGHADVSASVKLAVGVSGAGTVKYKGNPSVNQRVSGAGSVSKAE